MRVRWLLPGVAGLAVAVVISMLSGGPVRAASVPLSIAIQGNHFVNGAGQTIRLLGVDRTSSEYGCVDGFGYDDGHFDDADAAAIASWNANAVRIPLNEDCWLGINGQPNSSEGASPALTTAGYRQEIENYVAELNAHGIYAILDLHWTAPGSQVALEQQPMPDADHSPAFWQSVATAFKGNPAVVFDVFNEPYDPTDPRSGSDGDPQDAVTWNCWDTGTADGPAGGAACRTSAYDENGNKTSTYQVAGLQTLVNAIRGAGAGQPVMTGGLNYANDLSQWAAHAPDDPLGQEAASFHNYQGTGKCADVTCWDQQIAPVAAHVPVVTGEFAEDDYQEAKCANKAPSTFDADYMNWADQHGVSYLAWAWIVLSPAEQDTAGCGAYFLIGDYAGTPAPPNGTAVHAHLSSVSAVTTTTSSSTTTAPSGTSHPPAAGKSPSLSHDTVRLVGKTLDFSLRSPVACTVTISVQTVNRYLVPAARRRRPVRVSLGTAHVKLAANRTRAVRVALPKTARRLLEAHRTVRARATITLTSPAGRRVVRRALTLRRH